MPHFEKWACKSHLSVEPYDNDTLTGSGRFRLEFFAPVRVVVHPRHYRCSPYSYADTSWLYRFPTFYSLSCRSLIGRRPKGFPWSSIHAVQNLPEPKHIYMPISRYARIRETHMTFINRVQTIRNPPPACTPPRSNSSLWEENRVCSSISGPSPARLAT